MILIFSNFASYAFPRALMRPAALADLGPSSAHSFVLWPACSIPTALGWGGRPDFFA